MSEPIQRTTKEEIEKIIKILKQYNENQLDFSSPYYQMRRRERQVDQNLVETTFFQFDKIRIIEEEVLKYGDTGYDLHYEIEPAKTMIIGVVPLKNRLKFMHVILSYRKWQNRLKINPRF